MSKKNKKTKNRNGSKILNKFNALKNLKKDAMTIPNLLTFLRIMMVPAILWFLTYHSPFLRLLAFILYTVASVTDFFDGYLARRNNAISVTGKLLDPLADKFIVLLTYVLLVYQHEMSVLPVLLILAREFYIFGVRTLAIENRMVIAAGQGGKLKTLFQMFSMPFFILDNEIWMKLTTLDWPNKTIGTILVWISVFFAWQSAIDYTIAVKRKLFPSK